MGCGSSKPHWKDQYAGPCKCHHGYPVDKKTQKKYQKAYIKQAKRDRRKKNTMAVIGANTAILGYVLYPFMDPQFFWQNKS